MYSRTPKRRARPHAVARDRRSTTSQSRPPRDAAFLLCGGARACRAGASAGPRGPCTARAGGPGRLSPGGTRAGASTHSAPPRCNDQSSAGACAVASRGRIDILDRDGRSERAGDGFSPAAIGVRLDRAAAFRRHGGLLELAPVGDDGVEIDREDAGRERRVGVCCHR